MCACGIVGETFESITRWCYVMRGIISTCTSLMLKFSCLLVSSLTIAFDVSYKQYLPFDILKAKLMFSGCTRLFMMNMQSFN